MCVHIIRSGAGAGNVENKPFRTAESRTWGNHELAMPPLDTGACIPNTTHESKGGLVCREQIRSGGTRTRQRLARTLDLNNSFVH